MVARRSVWGRGYRGCPTPSHRGDRQTRDRFVRIKCPWIKCKSFILHLNILQNVWPLGIAMYS